MYTNANKWFPLLLVVDVCLKGWGVVVVVARVVGGGGGLSLASNPIPVHRSVVQMQAENKNNNNQQFQLFFWKVTPKVIHFYVSYSKYFKIEHFFTEKSVMYDFWSTIFEILNSVWQS